MRDVFRLDDIAEGGSRSWMVVWGCGGCHADISLWGGLVLHRSLVLGRGGARLRVVRLGGPKVRKGSWECCWFP